jgi:hypothetical protein
MPIIRPRAIGQPIFDSARGTIHPQCDGWLGMAFNSQLGMAASVSRKPEENNS